MRFPALIRRRELWLPTAAGWLAVLALVAVAAVLAVHNLYRFLALDDPSGAEVIVIEGWMSPRQLAQAAERLKEGRYSRAITTGGPLNGWFDGQGSFANRARDFLVSRGVQPALVVAVPVPQSHSRDRTYRNALAVKERLQKEGVVLRTLDVMSAGPHTRRSRFLYQVAFGESIRVGGLAAAPEDYEPDAWWRSSAGAGEVVKEAIAFAWAKAFFWPAER